MNVNGKTSINETMNPCTAEMDRRTYGCRALNFCVWGNRFICIGIFRITIDVYWSGWKRPLYARCRDGAILFHPLGCLSWPMPELTTPAKGE